MYGNLANGDEFSNIIFKANDTESRYIIIAHLSLSKTTLCVNQTP